VNQYLLDDYRIFDTGNDLDGAAAFTARFDVNTEHALEPLCPSHGRMTFSGCPILRLIRDFDLFTFTSLCRPHLYAELAVGCEHTVEGGAG